MKLLSKTLTSVAVSVTAAFSIFGNPAVAHHVEPDDTLLMDAPSQRLSSPLVLPPDSSRQNFVLVGDRVSIVATGNNTGGQFSLFDFIAPPQVGPAPHLHHEQFEAFYVLEGNLTFQLGNQATRTATPGTLVYVPPDSIHAWRNEESTPARFLVLTTPGVEGLFQAVGVPVTDDSALPPPPPFDPVIFDRAIAIGAEYGLISPDTLIFPSPEFTVNEDGTPIQPVSVFRPGMTNSPVDAIVALSDGTAIYPEDYSATQVPISFTDRQRLQLVPVSIVNDGLVEGNETINLGLIDPREGAIPALLQNTAVLTVLENNTLVESGGSNILNMGEVPNGFAFLPPSTSRPAFSLGDEIFSFLATGNDVNGQFSLFDVLVPPQVGAEPLIYGQENEAYYILNGNVSFQLEDQVFTATPETFVYLPKGNRYALTNLETTPASALLISAPSGLENFFTQMGLPIGDNSNPPTSVPVCQYF